VAPRPGAAQPAAAAACACDAEDEVCPICAESVDATDRAFFPCPCGFQPCIFCYHRILEIGDARCPACRRGFGAGGAGGADAESASESSGDGDSDNGEAATAAAAAAVGRASRRDARVALRGAAAVSARS
jgi:hypothetical protein